MMNARMTAAALLSGAVLIAGCRADREATEGVRLDAPEEIERAPEYPTEPRGVPVTGTPEAAAAAARERDTTVRADPDTIPQLTPPAGD